MHKSSRTSIRSYGKFGTRAKSKDRKSLLKPYNFCCDDLNDHDDETCYDKRKPPFSSSLVALSPVQGSPTLKFRFQSVEPTIFEKRKESKNKSQSKLQPEDWNLDGNTRVKTRGPLLWYQEDEIEIARGEFWSEKQKIYNEEADRNALIGEKKVKKKLAAVVNSSGPRWFQDLSIQQMKQVLALGDTITADYEETITVRTRNALAVIGVTSTFFKIAPQVIKKLQRSSKLQPIEFLREIYKRATGRYFEEEEYKKTYGCNERIILSAIAFLALPEAVIELNKRLPPISKPTFPPKPKRPRIPMISRNLYKSPYNEPFSVPPDWVAYRKCVNAWHVECSLIPRPRVILPRLKNVDKSNGRPHFEDEKTDENEEESSVEHSSETNLADFASLKKGEQIERKIDDSGRNFGDFSIPRLPGGDKQTFDFTISGLGEKSGPVNYKICGMLKPPFPKRKSWLGEKEAHYVISGISEHEDPPQCPVTYVMTGISCVTPDNSDDTFFAELKLGEGSNKRVYPSGRKNLSKNWQEWLQNADEEFIEVEREANKLIKSVEATMRLVIPPNRCDACCSCRQTRKANLKSQRTKTPYMVIDSIAEGDNQSKYIVGSLAMHSPAPSPAESTVNLLEVVASKETVKKKLLINGVTDDSGETTFYISGVTEEIEYTPKTNIIKENPPKPLRNVPPCACTIEQIFNGGKTAPNESRDDIPQTKKKGICFGRKYRPKESPAFTCKEYPDDKSCRRNPFDNNNNNKLKRGSVVYSKPYGMGADEESDQEPPKEKRMFSLPDFSPCGDEDGMAICGGLWGKKNVPTPEILAAREAEAKKILRAPPCGNTPGRAVCGGPWGATNPSPKAPKVGDEDEEEEEEEKGERRDKLSPREIAKLAKEAEAEERKKRRKSLKRDDLCSEKFDGEISDSNPTAKEPPRQVYCEFDTLWNRTRTAPTVNPWKNEYEKSLRLTQASPAASDFDEHKGPKLLTRRRNVDDSAAKKNRNLHRDGHKTGNDNVEVIYSGKQAAGNQPRSVNSIAINDNSLENKAKSSGKRNASPASKKGLKNSMKEVPKGCKTVRVNDVDVRNRGTDFKRIKRPSKVKSYRKSRHGKPRRGNDDGYRKSKTSMKNYCGNKMDKESPVRNPKLKHKSGTRKSRNSDNDARPERINKPQSIYRSSYSAKQHASSLKTDKNLKNGYNKVSPAIIPQEPRLPCQRDTVETEDQFDKCGCSDEEETNVASKEGPFGWRTKSQQALPREKTLVYLAEPGDEVEMVKVREGGRPCKCRENRNKKKILLYNIGGIVSAAKGRKGAAQPRIIEGVTYVTPPQSPRNSEEYIPEYEIFESPYKKCVRKRSDKDLKYIEELSTFKSLRPGKKSNAESCPCGQEPTGENSDGRNSPAKETVRSEDADDYGKAKSSSWSSALKDEGLIDHFVSCEDAVPCWLKCGKFSKAGCCAKPKLLQVKKPVCECRYERRVVKREEEKKNWVDRQQRLKSAKKQPYIQIGGTSRPMRQETKLMISSVKKVLKDGEFIPETQYCVTGVAENYAMGPPHRVMPGITMQSPVVTPEPSKPDILCMCGHRHWSPTDLTASNRPEVSSVKAKGEYPCRGRGREKGTGGNVFSNVIEEDDSNCNSTSEPYVGYRSCADQGGICSPAIDKGKQFQGKTKRELINGSSEQAASNVRQGSKKLKFDSEKVSQDARGGRRGNNIDRNITDIKISKPPTVAIKEIGSSEPSESKKPSEKDHNAQQNASPDSTSDLFELMKFELGKMASEDFVLAKLPECWLIPQLKSWIEYREGRVITDSMNEQLCDITSKRWEMMRQTRKPSIPPPSLNLSKAETAKMTFDRAIEIKKKIPLVKEEYFSKLRQLRVCEARSYWPTMEFGRFPSLSFKEAYFTYMPSKESDGHIFRPWKMGDMK